MYFIKQNLAASKLILLLNLLSEIIFIQLSLICECFRQSEICTFPAFMKFDFDVGKSNSENADIRS